MSSCCLEELNAAHTEATVEPALEPKSAGWAVGSVVCSSASRCPPKSSVWVNTELFASFQPPSKLLSFSSISFSFFIWRRNEERMFWFSLPFLNPTFLSSMGLCCSCPTEMKNKPPGSFLIASKKEKKQKQFPKLMIQVSFLTVTRHQFLRKELHQEIYCTVP